MKKLLLASSCAAMLFVVGSIQAQQPLLVPDDQVRVCEEHTVELIGSQLGVVNTSDRYGVRTSIPQSQVVSVEHEIWKSDDFLTSFTSSLFDFEREESGKYRIKTLIQTNNGCTYVSQFNVALYDRIISVIGKPLDEVQLLSESIDTESILIVQLTQDDLMTQEGQNSVRMSTTVMIAGEAVPTYLETIGDTTTVERLYVISDLDLATYRKLLATYSTLTSFNEIVVIERDAVGSFFTNLLLRPQDETQVDRQVFVPGATPGSSWGVAGAMIETLLTQGIPLQIIRFFLLIPLLALLMTLLRQVVGFTTYSIWYPLIIARCGMTIGRVETGLLVASGTLSVLVVSGITKKIYLLSGAKTALIGGIYAILCMIGYYGIVSYELLSLQIIEHSMLLYVIMILYVCMSIFRSPSLMLKRKWWIGICQFVIVTYSVVLVFESDFLFDALLTFPDIIRLAIVCIVIVGRFTGLQLTEYARFMPLISYIITEEEE